MGSWWRLAHGPPPPASLGWGRWVELCIDWQHAWAAPTCGAGAVHEVDHLSPGVAGEGCRCTGVQLAAYKAALVMVAAAWEGEGEGHVMLCNEAGTLAWRVQPCTIGEQQHVAKQ